MSLTTFLTRHKIVVKFLYGSEYLITQGCAILGYGFSKIIAGSLEIASVLVIPGVIFALIDDSNGLGSQLMLKKTLTEKLSSSLKPVCYILLSTLSLTLASRSKQITYAGPTPMVIEGSRVFELQNYVPSFVRFLHSRQLRLNNVRLNNEKLLSQHIYKLSESDRLNQGDIFYIMKLSKSFSEIEKVYFKKCFYSVRGS